MDDIDDNRNSLIPVKPEIRKFPRYSKFAVNQMHQVCVIKMIMMTVMMMMMMLAMKMMKRLWLEVHNVTDLADRDLC